MFPVRKNSAIFSFIIDRLLSSVLHRQEDRGDREGHVTENEADTNIVRSFFEHFAVKKRTIASKIWKILGQQKLKLKVG